MEHQSREKSINVLCAVGLKALSNISFTGAKKINFDDINSEREYNCMKAYRQSKLANVLFTRELSYRLQGKE
jgi:NAD(P)-dependent dehydrogenase (short-subunit alcohol dehydrogenase family)